MAPRFILCTLLLLFEFVFLLRLVMSFFPIRTGSGAATVRDVAVLATDPVLVPLRRRLPPLGGALAGIGLAEILILIGLRVLIGLICG